MDASRNEHTSSEIAALAARGLADPASLTLDEIRSVCASALTQAPDRDEPQPDEPSDGPPNATP